MGSSPFSRFRWVLAVVAVLVPAGCGPSSPTGTGTAGTPAADVVARAATARLLLAGDVMLGRGVAATVRADPEGIFAGVRHLLSAADLAGANLESPLTTRPHISPNPNALEADPGAADVVAAAGFDLLSVANNHAGDAGRASVLDTVAAVRGAGMLTVGGGADLEEAEGAVVVDRGGVRIAFLAYDATRAGTAATALSPGVAWWDESRVRQSVTAARAVADIVVVSVHGGVEYLPQADPVQRRRADQLASWGVDVVWGHGPHVLQPVSVIEGPGGRPTLVATSLGNLVFDQHRPGTTRGGLLEVLVGRAGVVAFRLGVTAQTDGRLRLDRWEIPDGDAVVLDGGWWSPAASPPVPAPSPEVPAAERSWLDGDVVDARRGDADGNGATDVVASFRRPYRPTLISAQFPDRNWADQQGRSAHLGVYRPDGRAIWVAGTMFRPVAELAVCDGALAFAFDELDGPDVVATGAWQWEGYGFTGPVELPGPGRPRCADVDGDGRLDAYLERKQP